jgi:hypothetical protein
MAPWWRVARRRRPTTGGGSPHLAGAAAPFARAAPGRPRRRRPSNANPVPAGSDVSAGTYKCTNCGYELEVGSTKNLPPCPSCHNGQYQTLSGGDSKDDPYPDS